VALAERQTTRLTVLVDDEAMKVSPKQRDHGILQCTDINYIEDY
jgi:hypothetical protein